MNLLTVTSGVVQHTFQQGSRAWLEHRFECNNASDAPAMLGCDDNRSRTDLLDALYIGFQQDVGAFKQAIYDDGHRYEGLARALAEKIVGEDLYPLVLSRDWSAHGIQRPVAASLDGGTLARKKNWEHKQLNAQLAEALPYPGEAGVHLNDAANLPKKTRVQMEQQFMVDDAQACLFTASKWAEDGTLIDARHCWYYPDPELRAEIVAGWVQAEADLAAHKPRAAEVKVVAQPVEALPVLIARVEGRVTESNLPQWRDAVIARIKAINRDLQTDEDFANAKAMVTLLEESGKKLVALKEQVLGGAADVLALMQSIDAVKRTMDDTRLELDPLVKARETAIRREIADEGREKLRVHIEQLTIRLSDLTPQRLYVMPEASHPKIAADFDKAIKNKRTIKSLRDSVDAELARAKIAASALADLLEKNLKVLHANHDHRGLFADWRILIFKEPEHCALEVRTRVADHLAEEARRREAERQREKNAMALQEIQGIQQQVIIATLGRAGVRKGGTIECIRDTLAETEAWTIDADRFGALTGSAQAAKDKAVSEIRRLLTEAEERAVAPARGQPEAAQNTAAADEKADWRRMPGQAFEEQKNAVVQPIRQHGASLSPDGDLVHYAHTGPARTPRGAPTLKLGEINARLSPLQVTAEGLVQLGFPVIAQVQGAKMFHEEDFPRMVDAMLRHLGKVGEAHRNKEAA